MELSNEWFDELEITLAEDCHLSNARVLRKSPPTECVDLSKIRPFKPFRYPDLGEFVRLALTRKWPALELATLAHSEANIRVNKGAGDAVLKEIKEHFNVSGYIPIEWLDTARGAIKEGRQNAAARGLASVYFVLVDGFTEENGRYGCYVGQTATRALEGYDGRQTARVAQHFCGIRAASQVKNRGIEPLWSLNQYTKEVPWVARMDIETSMHNALVEANVARVLGDTND